MERMEIVGFLSPAFRGPKVLLGLTAGPVRRGQLASAWMGKMGLMASLSQEFPVRKVPQAPKVLKAPLGMGLTGKMARMACLFLGRPDFKEAKDCLEMMVFLEWLAYQASMAPTVKMVCPFRETLGYKVRQENLELPESPESQELMGKTERTVYLFLGYLAYPDQRGLMVLQEHPALPGLQEYQA